MSNKLSVKYPIAEVSDEDDRMITAAAESDPDNPPLTDEEMAAMVPFRSIFGRPKKENPKQLVSIRFSPEVIAHFRASGPGWQTRIDEALKAHIQNEKRESPLP
jgi:uncharacterized protein (DUF4415 family)